MRVCAHLRETKAERGIEGEKLNKSSESSHTLALLRIGAQSQNPYRTIYSNQAVTFSSTPAGTSFTLSAAHTNTSTHIHIFSLCAQDFSQG